MSSVATPLDQPILEDIGARIIQHYWKRHRQRRPRTPGVVPAKAAPSPPPRAAAPAARTGTGSVLDFMPHQQRPTSVTCASGRLHSRPPRPRTAAGKPGAATAAAAKPPLPPRKPPGDSGSSGRPSSSSTPDGVKPLPLEDSAERMNRKAAAAGAPRSSAPTAAPAAAALAPTPRPRPASSQPQLDVRASASSEKLGSIMRMLERLEAQAAEEAQQVAPARRPPQPPAAVPAALPAPTSAATGQGAAPAGTRTQPQHPLSRVLAAQPLSLASKRMAAAPATDGAAAAALQAASASLVVRRSAELLTCSAPPAAAAPAAAAASSTAGPATSLPRVPQGVADAAAPASLAAPPAPVPQLAPAALPGSEGAGVSAAAVASMVRAKIQALQAAVAERDGQLEQLRRQVAASQAQHQAALRAAEEGHRVSAGVLRQPWQARRCAVASWHAGLRPPLAPFGCNPAAGPAGGAAGGGGGRRRPLPAVHRPCDGGQRGAGGWVPARRIASGVAGGLRQRLLGAGGEARLNCLCRHGGARVLPAGH